MLKNIIQAGLLFFSMYLIGTSEETNVLAMVLLAVVATLAAFESSRFLSALEVLLVCAAIILSMMGIWFVSMALLTLLAIENLAFLVTPVREWLQGLDGG